MKIVKTAFPLVWVLIMTSGYAQGATDPLTPAIAVSKASNQAERQGQSRIDRLDDATHAMLAEYQRLSRELDTLTRYHDQLQRMTDSQIKEQESIAQQLQQLDRTQREVLPLMLRQVAWLQDLLSTDSPFLADERRLRIMQLVGLMDRADISIGEKYRRVLEAYQIEMEYGRTLESYRGELATDAGIRTVDFLRFGRIGLYYQTLDRREVGHWNSERHAWEVLPDRYGRSIRDALRIARNQAAPELLRLPVSAPVTVGDKR